MNKILRVVAGFALCGSAFFPLSVAAQVTQVALAGLSYAGDAKTLPDRFPYSLKLEAAQKANGTRAFQILKAAAERHPNAELQFTAEQIADLKASDRALATTLTVSAETVSVERFGELRKLFVLIRGQAVFFDFKSMSVVRSYPLSFAYIDTFDRDPTEAEILDRVHKVYAGVGGKPGIYERYAATLGQATLPSHTSRYLQVTNIEISDEVKETLPAYLLARPGVAQTWAADMVSEAISTRGGVPIMPYTKDNYAIGNTMSMRVADGSVYTLTLPKPDYEISVKLERAKKIKFGENNVGASWIYGTSVQFKVDQPLANIVYIDTPLKNGEQKNVPATQTYVDDFPAFYDSWSGLFNKLALTVTGAEQKWIKSATKTADIDSQIKKFNTLLQQCK